MAQQKDDDSAEFYLQFLREKERIEGNRRENVKSVLVVLSSRGMAFDIESLRHKILHAYPEAKLYFRSTSGKAFGEEVTSRVDLLIDLTGPGNRQGWFYARKLRTQSVFAVGRNAGLFRKGSYDRIFDEKDPANQVPDDVLDRERLVQKEVLALAGVPASVPVSSATKDRSKEIALSLPPLHR